MSLSELIQDYHDTVDRCRELLESEIAQLQNGSEDSSSQVLELKASLIAELTDKLASLKSLASSTIERTTLDQSDLNFLQQKLMTVLKLDRELEKLLLSRSSGIPRLGTIPSVSSQSGAGHLYKKYSGR